MPKGAISWLGKPRVSDTLDRLTALSTIVAPEGDTAIFMVDLETSQRLAVEIPFEQMGQIGNLVRQTSGRMNSRLRQGFDGGASRLLELTETAQRPDAFDMLPDPINGDWVFVYQFRHAPPVSLRVEPEACMENMAITMRMIRAALN